MTKPDFKIGELVRTLSVSEVMERYNIHQGFGRPGEIFKPFVCKVTNKEFIQGNWMIMVEEVFTDDNKHINICWLDQHIFESYLPELRNNKINQILNEKKIS